MMGATRALRLPAESDREADRRCYHELGMTYRGRVQNGTVVLEPAADLPEGAEVRIEIDLHGDDAGEPDPLLRMPDLAVETEISDLATNVDHYLYGHPKANAG